MFSAQKDITGNIIIHPFRRFCSQLRLRQRSNKTNTLYSVGPQKYAHQKVYFMTKKDIIIYPLTKNIVAGNAGCPCATINHHLKLCSLKKKQNISNHNILLPSRVNHKHIILTHIIKRGAFESPIKSANIRF